jgi:YbbR domain-containing protein
MWNKFKSSRAFYALTAVLCAIVLWLYVDITTEPDASTTIRNIPVTFLGEEELNAQGLQIVEGADTTVTLEVSGVRTILSQLDNQNIVVTVDASQITGPGEQQLSYSYTLPGSISLSSVRIKRTPTTIGVNVVEIQTAEFPILGKFSGSVASGYLYDSSDFVFDVDTVTVSGECSIMDQIDHAQVVLEEEDLSKTWMGALPIQLVDQQGNVLDTSDLTMSVTEVATTFPIRAVKEVPLEVTFQSGGGATEKDIDYTLSRGTIMISGTDEQLETVNSINVGTIDLAKVITGEDVTFDLQMPTGIVNESGLSSVTVSVTISGLTTKKVETSNISIINVPEGYTAKLVTTSLEVRIRGDRDTMSLLTAQDVYVEADLSEVGEDATGTCTIPATVKVQGMNNIGAIDSYSVLVEISAAEPEATQAPQTAAS